MCSGLYDTMLPYNTWEWLKGDFWQVLEPIPMQASFAVTTVAKTKDFRKREARIGIKKGG